MAISVGKFREPPMYSAFRERIFRARIQNLKLMSSGEASLYTLDPIRR